VGVGQLRAVVLQGGPKSIFENDGGFFKTTVDFSKRPWILENDGGPA
jgi:hypothetical protein